MSFMNSRFGYSKVDKEDPDEVIHRRAQFLIYKALKQADSSPPARRRLRPSWLKVRATKLKVRIGKRLRRLRKTILSILSVNNNAEVGNNCFHYKHIISQLKAFKALLIFQHQQHPPPSRHKNIVPILMA